VTNHYKKGRGQSHVTRLLFCPNRIHIFVIGEARHLKFRVLVDLEEYECMHDELLPRETCSESRDLFKFWEISNNISETVQHGDIVAMED